MQAVHLINLPIKQEQEVFEDEEATAVDSLSLIRGSCVGPLMLPRLSTYTWIVAQMLRLTIDEEFMHRPE